MSHVKFINKDNLKTARENIGLSTLSATKKISSTKKDVVKEWEEGESLPTWKQVSKLAHIYNVPELAFFTEKRLEPIKVIPDYRVGIENNEEDEQVKKLINVVVTRQRWLEKKLKEEKFPINNVQGSGKNISHPNELADFILESLEIDLKKIKSFSGGTRGRKKTLSYLISRAEKKGIFVGKTMAHIRIKVSSMRGLFISNDYCPFIILNRKDAVSAQIFSLTHELAHLFRKTDAISNTLDFRNVNKNVNPEEVFCNKVAAELLLPREDFVQNSYEKSDIEKLSELYKVSQIFVFYRLKDLGRIPLSIQDRLEDEIKTETRQNIQRKEQRKKDGGNYNNNMKDSNGRLFNRLVSNFYFRNQIDYVEASNLLKFSVEHHG